MTTPPENPPESAAVFDAESQRFSDGAVELVEKWLAAAHEVETAADRETSARLHELIEDPDGVAFTMFGGERKRSMRVWLDRRALAARLNETPPADRLAWRDDLHREFLAFSDPAAAQVKGSLDLAQVATECRRQAGAEATIVTDAGSFSLGGIAKSSS